MATQLTPVASLPIVAGTMGSGAAAATSQNAIPTIPLVVPDELKRRLAQAVAAGKQDAARFAQTHGPAERARIAEWATLKAPFAPRSDEADLKELHAIAASRTEQGLARARYWSSHGLDETWMKLLEQYKAKVGPAQARAAQALMDDALMATNMATQVTKARDMRKRPYDVDPTLKLAVDKPGNNPSHPSGHTTAAYAAAMVLAHLMPDRAGEFMGLAQEASYARLYAGVHFPTDVIDGARLASTVATYLTRIAKVRPVHGTAPGGAASLGMRALPMGSRLSGEPLAGAVQLTRA